MAGLLVLPLLALASADGVAAPSQPAPTSEARFATDATHAVRLILLGTKGGPTPSKWRAEPASLLIVDGTPYLIDAGAGVTRQLALAGIAIPQVHTVFITHHHLDHNGGLPEFLESDWFENAWEGRADTRAQVYGPPGTEFLVRTALQYLSVSERIFRAGIPALPPSAGMFSAHDIAHGGPVYADDKVRVSAVENSHYALTKSAVASGDKSYAYRFDTAAGAVVFTGDTGPSPAVAALARGAAVLVSEVLSPALSARAERSAGEPASEELLGEERAHLAREHLTPEEVGKLATAAGVRVVVLTHFVPGDETEDMSPFTEGVARYFKGTVIPGRDLFEYDLYPPAR